MDTVTSRKHTGAKILDNHPEFDVLNKLDAELKAKSNKEVVHEKSKGTVNNNHSSGREKPKDYNNRSLQRCQ